MVLETGGSYWRKRLDLPTAPELGAALPLLEVPPLVATVVGATEPEGDPEAATQAALAALREGIDFCERRGITELALGMVSESLHLLVELGQPEQALTEAAHASHRRALTALQARHGANGSTDGDGDGDGSANGHH